MWYFEGDELMWKDVGNGRFKNGHPAWNKGKTGFRSGPDNNFYIDGRTKSEGYKAKVKRDWRHATGESKRYSVKYGGVLVGTTLSSRLKSKMHKQRYKALRKGGGPLSIATIQCVYEDNIKFFGVLTCVYCNNPIIFGNDSLDHRTPLSNGGDNSYDNLVVSCKNCNSKKHDKSWNEFFWKKGEKRSWR